MANQDELKQLIMDRIAKEAILLASKQAQEIIPPEEWDKMPVEDRREIIRYLAEAYAQGALSGAQAAIKAKKELRKEQNAGKE